MPRKCTVCSHPCRDEIEQLLTESVAGYRKIAGHYFTYDKNGKARHLSPSAVYRHAHNHMDEPRLKDTLWSPRLNQPENFRKNPPYEGKRRAVDQDLPEGVERVDIGNNTQVAVEDGSKQKEFLTATINDLMEVDIWSPHAEKDINLRLAEYDRKLINTFPNTPRAIQWPAPITKRIRAKMGEVIRREPKTFEEKVLKVLEEDKGPQTMEELEDLLSDRDTPKGIRKRIREK